MFSFRLNGGSRVALAAGVMLATATIAQAALAPVPASLYSVPEIQTVGCVVGAHLGPLGACIGGYHHHHHRHCWTDDQGERVCN
jgi:hypothetical protein